MPYLRQRQRIAANGRIGVRLNPGQRDQLLRSPLLSRQTGHLLHRAPVRKGKLEIRLDRASLDAMILAAASFPEEESAHSKVAARRAHATFLRYLEGLADRFEEPEETAPEDQATGTG
jgi:hypothetical protein